MNTIIIFMINFLFIQNESFIFAGEKKFEHFHSFYPSHYVKKESKLWSASSVMSAAKALLEKDFITQEQGAYVVYDRFFALWLLRG